MGTLRRLNSAGLTRFASLLDDARNGREADFNSLRDDVLFTTEVEPSVQFPDFPGDGKLEVGKCLYETLAPLAAQGPIDRDTGLWAWIALAWIDGLAPLQADGKRKVLSTYRWIPEVNVAFRYYRHLLVVPYLVYREHHDDPSVAMVLLAGKVQQPGDMNENLASRAEILASPSVLGAATRLYYDASKGKVKRGARDKRGGSVQRFGIVLNQYVLTWDFDEKSSEEIVTMLPAEFSRFRGAPARGSRRRSR